MPLSPAPAVAAAPKPAGPAAAAAAAIAAPKGLAKPKVAGTTPPPKTKGTGIPGWLIAVGCGVLAVATFGVSYLVLIRVFPDLPLPGAAGSGGSQRAIVVGVQSADLFQKADLATAADELPAGAAVKLLDVKGDALLVSSGHRKGWTRRCNLATADEYRKRQADGRVPVSIMCIGWKGDSAWMYGTIPIHEGEASLTPGTAVWLDPTMRGRSFTLGDEEVQGDPDVLYFVGEDGTLSSLDLKLPATATGSSE